MITRYDIYAKSGEIIEEPHLHGNWVSYAEHQTVVDDLQNALMELQEQLNYHYEMGSGS